MRKYGALIALGLAIVFGAAAVMMTNRYLSSKTGQPIVMAKEAAPSVEIVVPAKDIEIGTRLNKENLALLDWPKEHAPQGAFSDMTQLEGQVSVTKLFKGRPIIQAELAAEGSGAGLVALIEPGKRAMAIRVDEVTGVGGFILPNAIVDVIGVEKSGKKEVARTILQKIKVMAIAQETYPDEEGKPKIVRTVTMELKPVEAEKLALQTHKGSIHLVLRNPLDQEVPPPPKIVKKAKKRRIPTLKSRVKATQAEPFSVEILRGSERDTVRFKHMESEERK